MALALCLTLFPAAARAADETETCQHEYKSNWTISGNTYTRECTNCQNKQTVTISKSGQQEYFYGAQPTLSVGVEVDPPSGDLTIAYQWSKDGKIFVRTPEYKLPVIDAGTYKYHCLVTANGDELTKDNPGFFDVKVLPAQPEITFAGLPQALRPGTSAEFTVTAKNLYNDSLEVPLTLTCSGEGTVEQVSGNTYRLTINSDAAEGANCSLTVGFEGSNYTLPSDFKAPSVKVVGKEPVTITGIQAESTVYDGQPHKGYAGTPVTAPGGLTASQLAVSYTDDNDGPIDCGPEGPTEIGSYKVTFEVPDDNPNYTGSKTLNFSIGMRPGPVLVLTPSKSLCTGGELANVTVTLSGHEGLRAEDLSNLEITCGIPNGAERPLSLSGMPWHIPAELLDEDPNYYTFTAFYGGNDYTNLSHASCIVTVLKEENTDTVNLVQDGSIKLPKDKNVLYADSGSSSVTVDSIGYSNQAGSSTPCNLIFRDGGNITVEGDVNISGADNSQVTVQNGTRLTVEGQVSVGASGGQNGPVLVVGNGSILETGGLSCSSLTIADGGEVILNSPLYLGSAATLTLGSRAALTVKSGNEDRSILEADGSGTPADRQSFDEIIKALQNAGSLSKKYTTGEHQYLSSGSIVTGYMLLDENGNPVQELTLYGEGHTNFPADKTDPVTPPAPEVPSRPGTPSHPGTPSAPSGTSSSRRHTGTSTGAHTYSVTIRKTEGGTVTASRTRAQAGTAVTLTAAPWGGYTLSSLTAADSQGNEVPLTALEDGYTFRMPGRDVIVTPVFSGSCDGGADCPTAPFSDLDSGAWYHEAIDYVLRNGLMSGYGNGTFGPNVPLTRGHLVQVLYNLSGRPAPGVRAAFSDVAEGTWCADAVSWAAERGIAAGYSGGRFGPGDFITREQLAVMLWRYAGSPAAGDAALPFADADTAGSYALAALRWASSQGVINGKSGNLLDPKGPATRAQTAQMLKNFLNG